jgi:hypothetical protein
MANGYPKRLVERTIKECWKIELEKEMKRLAEELAEIEKPEVHPDEKNEDYYDVLYAPYIAGFSERLQKALSPFKIGIAHKTERTLFNPICKLRPK